MKKQFVCKNCGSNYIREAVFVWYNTREEIDSVFDNIWCQDCDSETVVIPDVEIKEGE